MKQYLEGYVLIHTAPFVVIAGTKLENSDKLFNGKVEKSRLRVDMMDINCLVQSARH